MIRTAVIGLTAAGYEHARAYRTDSRAELVGVCDDDAARADEAAHALGVPAFTDAAQLLAKTNPDLVTVRSGQPQRAQAIGAALESGASVVASLPFARDIRDIRELTATAKQHGLILAADFHLRFTPAWTTARRWLDADVLGTPLFINMNLWTRGKENSGRYELFRNLGAHAADIMRHFCGEVKRIQCFGVETPKRSGGPVWSSAQMNMAFADETVGNLTLSYDMVPHHPMARVEVAGTKARFVIDNVYEEAILYVHAEQEKRVITNSIFGGVPQLKDTYGRRIGRLLEQIEGGAKPEEVDGGAADALAAGAVMEAAIRSLEDGSVAEVETIEGTHTTGSSRKR